MLVEGLFFLSIAERKGQAFDKLRQGGRVGVGGQNRVAVGRAIQHPTRIVPLAFLAVIVLGTVLLSLPVARAGWGTGGAPIMTALFTATSAVCVTGLTVVDTGTYWSPFGQVVILFLFQVGGLGIMTAATLLGLIVSNRLSLGRRLLTQAETRTMALGDVRAALRLILLLSLSVQLVTTLLLFLRLHFGYGETVGSALWNGFFHAASSFNNAGFTRYAGGATGFAGDALILIPMMVAILLGTIGFPVLYELRREARTPRTWSLHTKLTLTGAAGIMLVGVVMTLMFEWNNARTIGEMGVGEKLLNAMFHTVNRTSGFNSVDVGAMRPETLLVTNGLMLIGGGSGGTAGGIKITTFMVISLIVWTELLGERDTQAFRRRIPAETARVALSIVLLSILLISLGTLALLSLTQLELGPVLFEAVSAAATVGLSTGITPHLPPSAQLVLVVLMYVGRIGAITAAAAIVLRSRPRPYRYPEERPIIG
jgi:Trk-type K+ transport system membrane component